MSTSRAAFFVGLLCASSVSAATGETPKWEPKNETFADWPTVSFSDGKKSHLLYYRRADAAKCDKNKKSRSCLVDLYDLNAVGEPKSIKSNKTVVTPNPRSDTGITEAPFSLGKTKEIDSKLTSYATTLSNYKLDVNEKHLQVVQGDLHYDAAPNHSISTEGSQIFVLPPKSGKRLKDLAPKIAKGQPKDSQGGTSKGETGASSPTEQPVTPPPAAAASHDELQKKNLQAQKDKEAAAANYRPQFDATGKDQSAQFAPYMTAKELAAYKAGLPGVPEMVLEYNKEQLKKIADRRTPYPNEEYITAANFEHLSPWEVERFCDNFHKGKDAKNVAAAGWKTKACPPAKDKNAVSDRLTVEEMSLLTPAEWAIYKKILESGGNLEASTALYREKIKKDGRTKPYIQPRTKAEYAALEEWQKRTYCSGLPGAGTAVTSSNPEFDPGTKDTKALKDLQNIAAANAPQNTKSPIVEDWAAEACALKKIAAGGGSSTKEKKVVPSVTSQGGLPPNADEGTANTGGPSTGQNKWLKPEHLYNGAKGSLVGILLGSLGGPVGMMAGAAAGALFFYGLSMITSDKK